MHRSDCASDAFVRESLQQAGGRSLTWRDAERFDQEDFHEPQQNEVASGARLTRLIADERYEF